MAPPENITKILLINTDKTTFERIRKLLQNVENRQYQLDWGNTYKTGLEAIFAQLYDVYLIDQLLDGNHTGLELLVSRYYSCHALGHAGGVDDKDYRAMQQSGYSGSTPCLA